MRSVLLPKSIDEAAAALAQGGARPLAGATWIMRAPLRGEALAETYVALSGVEALRAIAIGREEIAIGAAVTHAALAAALAAAPDCAALVEAAVGAANPAIREAATIGGNLCAQGFAASDLAPALVALDAAVELRRPSGAQRMPIETFLASRADLPPGYLMTRIIAPRSPGKSAHVRLPLRRAGDYPVAIVSLAAAREAGGGIAALRIAVGSVEPFARRWERLEQALVGRPIDAHAAAEAARDLVSDFSPRDSVEAPAWYRSQILPSLVRQAFQRLRERF